MEFDLTEALKVANQAVFAATQRNLTDVEVIVIKGSWVREEYDRIAAQHQYATSYISQDVAPKLWKLLSLALGEKVRKSNFKEALKRYWEKQSSQPEVLLEPPAITERKQQKSLEVNLVSVEAAVQELLATPGCLICLQAPKQKGGMAWLDRLLSQLSTQNYRIVQMSFEFADPQAHFFNLNQFLRWFCLNLVRELGLPNQLDEGWDEECLGAKVSCTTYLEEYVFPQLNEPLILYLNDLDLLFPYGEVCEDFLGLLRSWYEKTRNRPLWRKLRLLLVQGTDRSMNLPINQSPFQVGYSLKLPEFS
ncbi:MAG: AAA-like domain-containing protein [Desertifilum sp.]|nr:AAA-like domain-containing protein [Desertifilum sp.]